MSYQSVDALQRALAESVFSNRQDVKKAAGRALGTIVELITFYILREWGLLGNMSIERGLAEFANDKITHNVEFGVHPIVAATRFSMTFKGPLTSSKILSELGKQNLTKYSNIENSKANELLSTFNVLRNSCTISESDKELIVANLISVADTAAPPLKTATIEICKLRTQPFAMIECKRVGVEEGMKKGPTTIEKAKQGAYVAKHISSLQKIRGHDGTMFGAMPQADGTFKIRELKAELKRLIFDADVAELDKFILTVGLVSNHGNWFTSNDPNKELLVLKQSYDWLLFLTDPAIGEFVEDTILSNAEEMKTVRAAFHDSYASGEAGKNHFTKVKIGKAAHDALVTYFHKHIQRIETTWFNVLSPKNTDVHELKRQLHTLAQRL